jgi:hypothetical protein
MTRRRSFLLLFIVVTAMLAPSVCSAGARLYAVWQPNGSTTWVKVNAGGLVGNIFKIRCVIQPDPPDLFISTGSGSGTMTENGPHSSSAFAMSSFSQVAPNASWGDPTSNVVVLESTVSFPNLHNSPYTFNITCGGDVFTMMGRVFRTWNTSMQLTIQNLTVVSCSPTNLLVWNGTQGTTLPVAVTLADDDLLDPMNLTLTIYSTKADNRISWPVVRTMSLSGVTGANQAFSWNGKDDAGNYVEPWTYTFSVTASHTGFYQDVVSYRSAYLSLIRATDSQGGAISDAEYDGIDDNGTPTDTSDDNYMYYVRCYVLKDTGNPVLNASEGKVMMYDPDLAKVDEWNVSSLPCRKHSNATDGLTASSTGLEHELLIKVPTGLINRAGEYIFVAAMKDGHTNDYRAHDNRWTKELNSHARYPGLAIWSSDVSTNNLMSSAYSTAAQVKEIVDSTGKKFQGYIGWGPLGYPDIGGSDVMCTSETPVFEVIRTLRWLAPWDSPSNSKYLSKNAIFAYYGHSTQHTLSPFGKPDNGCLADDTRLDQTTQQIGMFAVNPSTGQPYFANLDHVLFVYLFGCDTAGTCYANNPSSITARFILKGAKSALGYSGPVWGNTSTYSQFDADFWYGLSKLGLSVKRAAIRAYAMCEVPSTEMLRGVEMPSVIYWGGGTKIAPPRYGNE